MTTSRRYRRLLRPPAPINWPPQDIEPTRAEREELERRIAAAKTGPHKPRPVYHRPEPQPIREIVLADGPRFLRRCAP